MSAVTDKAFEDWCKSELFRIFAVPPGGYSRGNGAGVKNTSSSAAIMDPEVKAFYGKISGYTSMYKLKNDILNIVKNNDIPDISESTQKANGMSTYYAGTNDTTRENRFISSLNQRYNIWSDADAAGIVPPPVVAPTATHTDGPPNGDAPVNMYPDQSVGSDYTPVMHPVPEQYARSLRVDEWNAAAIEAGIPTEIREAVSATIMDGSTISIDALIATYTPKDTPPPTPGAGPTPVIVQASTPVDNRTTDQKMSDFYVKLADAQADARAGNPQKLRDFDAFFNISRPEAEYTQAFYQTSSARLNEVNSLNVSQDIKNQIILEIQSGNQDSVQNLVNWFGAGKPASAVAVNLGTTQDGRIGLANALNVSQKVKDQIILEIQAGNPDSVQNLANWFNAGKPHSDAVMAIINAPAPVVATTPAVVGAVQPTAVTQPTAVQPTAVTQPTATVYPYYPSQSQGTNTNTGLASTGLDPSSDEYQYLSRKKGIDTAERMSAGAYKSTVAENETGLTKAWADFKAVNDELKAKGYSYLEAKDGMYGKAVSERGSYYDYLKKVEGPKGNINSVYGATAAGVIVNPIGNPTSPQFDQNLRDLANRAGAGGPHTLSGASSSLAQAKSFQEIQDRLIAKGVDLVKLEQDNPYSAGFGNNQQAMFGAVPATGQLNVSHPAGVLAGSNKTIDIFKEVEAATIQPANQTAQQPIISSNFDPGFNGPTAKPATGINAKPGYDSSQASTSGTASGSHTPNVVAQRGGEMSADDAFTAAPVTANGGTHVRNTKDSGFAYPWSAAKATGSSDVMGTIGKAVNFMNKHEGKNYKYDKAKGTIQAEDGSFISKEDVQSLNNIITKYHKTDFESPKASGSAPAQTSTFSAINEPTQDSLFANNSSNAAKIDGATNKDLFELPGATGVDVRTHPIEGGFNLP